MSLEIGDTFLVQIFSQSKNFVLTVFFILCCLFAFTKNIHQFQWLISASSFHKGSEPSGGKSKGSINEPFSQVAIIMQSSILCCRKKGGAQVARQNLNSSFWVCFLFLMSSLENFSIGFDVDAESAKSGHLISFSEHSFCDKIHFL